MTENRQVNGRWLCSVVDGCDEPAAAQAAVACNDCGDVAATASSAVADRAAESEAQQGLIDTLVEACTTEERSPTDAELAMFRVAETSIVTLAAETRRLQNVARTHEVEHTHPVFACPDHDSLLPPQL